MAPYTYHRLRPPPKSKTPFYSSSLHWTDITPIPLLESDPSKPDPGPALATIAYSERYLEAMSYLRAVMALNEASERVLALTEDVIGMNPAHYTVWGYRMRSLRDLWGVGEYESRPAAIEQTDEERDEVVRLGVERELDWLEAISERNLKNYQIWHHRQSLLSLLPLPNSPQQISSTTAFLHDTEIPFLTHILSFDAKNYHVWTYRQWLCRRYSAILLSPLPTSQDVEQRSSEVLEMEKLIEEDVRNNSAWSHRYFCVFGHQELNILEAPSNLRAAEPLIRKNLFCVRNGGTRGDEEGNLLGVEEGVRSREVGFAKVVVERTPQNPSPWNYLQGVVKRCDIPQEEMRKFCEGFVRPKDQAVTKGEEKLDFKGEGVRSSHAIAWLADIYAAEGSEDGKRKARECWESLSEKWDPIRKNYWKWRERGMEEGSFGPGL